MPSFTHNFVTHTHIIIIFLCHTPTFICNFVTTTSTTSFVFPSFLAPATTFGAHYWKKLTCGVIRSFDYLTWNPTGVIPTWVQHAAPWVVGHTLGGSGLKQAQNAGETP